MKAIIFLLFPGLLLISSKSSSGPPSVNDELTGIYDGLTEYMEFQFTATDDKIYLFDEVEDDLEYDLYDESYIGQKFKVNWEKRTIDVLDSDDEPTGEKETIKVIVGLEKL